MTHESHATPGPDPGLGNPADLETAPVLPLVDPAPKPAGPGPRRISRGLVTGYFAAGVVLLVLGSVAVVVLGLRAYGKDVAGSTTVTISRGSAPASPAPASGGSRADRQKPGVAVEPSSPLRARLGPQKLAEGQAFVMAGENDARFRITVKAGKFRKGGCDPYAVEPEHGGYLPVKLTLKVLEGEPEVSEYSFRFQLADGTWLNSVGGSGCDGDDYLGFFRRQSVGRTYTSTVVYDVPSRTGEIVFVYPLMDVAAEWKLK